MLAAENINKKFGKTEVLKGVSLTVNKGEVVALIGQSGLDVISRAADCDFSNPLLQLDKRAYELWALGAGLPEGLMLRQGVAVV